jgi:hypothetical protein
MCQEHYEKFESILNDTVRKSEKSTQKELLSALHAIIERDRKIIDSLEKEVARLKAYFDGEEWDKSERL